MTKAFIFFGLIGLTSCGKKEDDKAQEQEMFVDIVFAQANQALRDGVYPTSTCLSPQIQAKDKQGKPLALKQEKDVSFEIKSNNVKANFYADSGCGNKIDKVTLPASDPVPSFKNVYLKAEEPGDLTLLLNAKGDGWTSARIAKIKFEKKP